MSSDAVEFRQLGSESIRQPNLIASELPRAAAVVPPLSRLVGYSPADAALCDGSPVRSARPANRRVAGRAQRPPRSATTAPTEGCPPPSPLSRDWGWVGASM